jgi:hypothetical protein
MNTERGWAFDVNDPLRQPEAVEDDLRELAAEMRDRGVQAYHFEIEESADTVAMLLEQSREREQELRDRIDELEQRLGITAERDAKFQQHVKRWRAEAAAERRKQFDVIDGGRSSRTSRHEPT